MELETRYGCNGCGERHKDENSAIFCCPPSTIYLCQICGLGFGIKEEALSCCGQKEQSPEEGKEE